MIVMCRVTGFFAFGSRSDERLRERILTGRFVDSGRFSTLTDKCRHLVSKMLQVNPNERYSAEEALNHPWFSSDEESGAGSIPHNVPSDCDRSAMVSTKRMNE